jgi:hypothetical protein
MFTHTPAFSIVLTGMLVRELQEHPARRPS